jgi:hypothetical protein
VAEIRAHYKSSNKKLVIYLIMKAKRDIMDLSAERNVLRQCTYFLRRLLQA